MVTSTMFVFSSEQLWKREIDSVTYLVDAANNDGLFIRACYADSCKVCEYMWGPVDGAVVFVKCSNIIQADELWIQLDDDSFTIWEVQVEGIHLRQYLGHNKNPSVSPSLILMSTIHARILMSTMHARTVATLYPLNPLYLRLTEV